MPYIKAELREELKHRPPAAVGELTYLLYCDVLQMIESDKAMVAYDTMLKRCSDYLNSDFPNSTGFARHAEILGGLASAMGEIRRNFEFTLSYRALMLIEDVIEGFYDEETGLYEDEKRHENGDVTL